MFQGKIKLMFQTTNQPQYSCLKLPLHQSLSPKKKAQGTLHGGRFFHHKAKASNAGSYGCSSSNFSMENPRNKHGKCRDLKGSNRRFINNWYKTSVNYFWQMVISHCNSYPLVNIHSLRTWSHGPVEIVLIISTWRLLQGEAVEAVEASKKWWVLLPRFLCI